MPHYHATYISLDDHVTKGPTAYIEADSIVTAVKAAQYHAPDGFYVEVVNEVKDHVLIIADSSVPDDPSVSDRGRMRPLSDVIRERDEAQNVAATQRRVADDKISQRDKLLNQYADLENELDSALKLNQQLVDAIAFALDAVAPQDKCPGIESGEHCTCWQHRLLSACYDLEIIAKEKKDDASQG